MLDTVAEAWSEAHDGASIWEDHDVTFLDPFTKSGVFLREITRRLTEGLAEQLPDLEERVDHILTKQVYGIGITQLTALLARRSVYCSKDATGEHSIASSFDRDWGNIWFERTEHTWAGGKCAYCGAGKAGYDREDELETHAYAFIHTTDIKTRLARMFGADMQVDVIIGNPPYQLSTGSSGGAGVQARPLYNVFVEQAKKLEPRMLAMITPSRWFSGGMGLDAFRASMLSDPRLRALEDFPDSNDVFPGTQVKGGVSYWLWERDSPGDVRVTTHDKGSIVSTAVRPLLEPGVDVFIRYNEGVEILRKVARVERGDGGESLSLPPERQFRRLVSSIGAFGLDSTFQGAKRRTGEDLKVYRNGGIGYLPREELAREQHAVDLWKVFIPRAGSGSDSFPHPILGRPFLGEPGSISSWTYMYIGPFETAESASNVMSYIATRLFRLLVLLHKPSQDATPRVYTFVPVQDFSCPWTDGDLYAKYGITDDEIAFIESMVRPMELDDAEV